MSFQTTSELDLITINTGKSANAVSTKNDETTPHQQEILKKHNKVFQGLGKLSDFQATLHIDKSVKPVTQKPRRIPFHLRQKTETSTRKPRHHRGY